MEERCRTNFTMYTKHYVEKPVKNLRYLVKDIKKKQKQYNDPITESFKKFLTLEPTTRNLWEEVDEYYERSVDIFPWMKEITNGQPADKKIIKKDQIFDGRSQYQVDFCDIETEVADKEREKKERVVLAEDIQIPLSTQKTGYRNPVMINSRAYEVTDLNPPAAVCSLDPNDRIRKILNVKTGDTEYMGRIGKLGKQIIVEALHGVIIYDV